MTSFKVDERIISPYKDEWEDGSPMWPVFMSRWCDRMDCIDPYFFIRHFCTLLSNKEDYTIVNGERVFHKIDMEEHMYPFALTEEQKKTTATMRTHVEMFLNSQNENTPYGKNDIQNSVMVSFREHQKTLGWEVIAMLDNPLPRKNVLDSYGLYNLLKSTSMSNRDLEIRILVDKFMKLPDDIAIPWLSAFTKIQELIITSNFPMENKFLGISKKLFLK